MLDFSARLNRSRYFIHLFVSTLALTVVGAILDLLPEGNTVTYLVAVTFLLGILAWIVFLMCIVRQRANDIGWHPLLLTVAAFGFVVTMLAIGLVPGEKKPNRYGPVPK